MNIINQERSDIIKDQNTAQTKLLTILEKLNIHADKLIIRERLYGDLDFSVLRDNGFNVLNTIVFEQIENENGEIETGKITSISNLPDGIIKFECPNNLLTSFDENSYMNPSSLLSLNISNNYLTYIDISKMVNLINLNVSDNKITKLENFPPTIREIHCNNNQLERLDFYGVELLNVLNFSNNKISIIENLPPKIIQLLYDNNPNIEFINSPNNLIDIIKGGSGEYTENDDDDNSNIANNKNYIDTLKEYFRLKHNYEDKLFKMKKTTFENADNKLAGKRAILSIKPTCIKCKRPVGTNFFRKDGRYNAICGDTQNPCPLNIQIYAGGLTSLSTLLYIFKEDADDWKDAIIRQKLDTLFSYVSEERSVVQFKKKLEAYNKDSQMYKELLDAYNELYHNEQKKELISKKSGIIFGFIEQIRLLLLEYEKTGNSEVLKMAMDLQVKDLFPEILNRRIIENSILEMNSTKILNTDILQQEVFKYPVLLPKLDFTFGEPPRVIKYIR